MSVSRNLEREIDSVKSEVSSVIDQLLQIISEQEDEIDDLNKQIEILEEDKL
tara:strand:+ start:617 stop:772 length:156 start_codon:yes stop_codon:yes gene_type:complete